MSKRTDDRVFRIDPDTAPFGLRNSVARALVEHMVGLPKLDNILREGRKLKEQGIDACCFADYILMGMDVETVVKEEDKELIPREGPVIVVSNHPFGGIEGVVLLSLRRNRRPDSKVLANYMLQLIPELREQFIPVNPFGTKDAARENITPLVEAMKWLRSGNVLGVFPAGEVSSVDLKSGRVRDPAWSVTVAGIARKTKATVVPVFFAGRNPAIFQIAGLIHPRLRTIMLPSMMDNKKRSSIEAYIGTPIKPSEFARFPTDEELIKYFRLRTYAQEGRVQKKAAKHKQLLSRRREKQEEKALEDIISETPVEQIEKEIAKLPEETLLIKGELDVYLSKLQTDSAILREIGRLREITFREVGEGTGRKTDIDVFDSHYYHLFLWNTKTRQIVGAYRLGLADEIQKQFGAEGLYTNTLFKFDDKFLNKFQPCVELGRSFVRPEFQRTFAPLLFLWKGIGVFISRNPKYANLFGPVSITADYRDTSRNMILRSLRLSNFAAEYARFVKPRTKLRKSKTKEEWQNPVFNRFIGNVDEVSRIIQDIESDNKGVPILIKQYLKLGGKILAFNVDPDFSDVLDGLILIDVRETDRKTRIRYMGEEADRIFCDYHKLPTEANK
ncbi:MAG: lysophospholipid acyltransferase family protein [Lentisphaerae bacterium]|nr:lysophospholipid acyltransferase family protein [Lentisphaerota bacterium]